MSLPDVDWKSLTWRTAAACNAGSCVQVARVGGSVAMRNSKQPEGLVLIYSPDEWLAFMERAKKGEFDSFMA